MTATRNGVYHNLKESPWSVAVGPLTFYFASYTHFNRFMSLYRGAGVKMSGTMGNRIGCAINMTLPAVVQLYRRVETYGCAIELEGEGWIECLDDLEFDGPKPRRHGFAGPSDHITPPSLTLGE